MKKKNLKQTQQDNQYEGVPHRASEPQTSHQGFIALKIHSLKLIRTLIMSILIIANITLTTFQGLLKQEYFNQDQKINLVKDTILLSIFVVTFFLLRTNNKQVMDCLVYIQNIGFIMTPPIYKNKSEFMNMTQLAAYLCQLLFLVSTSPDQLSDRISLVSLLVFLLCKYGEWYVPQMGWDDVPVLLVGIMIYFLLAYYSMRLGSLLNQMLKHQDRMSNQNQYFNQLMSTMQKGFIILDQNYHIQFINDYLSTVLQAAQDNNNVPHDLSSLLHNCLFKLYNLYESQEPNLKNEFSLIQLVQTLKNKSKKVLVQYDLKQSNTNSAEAQDQQSDIRIFSIKMRDIMYANQPCYFIYLQDLTSEMETQKAQMENKYSQLTTQTLSHELMTPLNSIINLSELCLKMLDGLCSREPDNNCYSTCNGYVPQNKTLMELKYLVEVTYISSQQMALLVKSQLDIQHINQGTFVSEQEETELKEEIMRVFQLFGDQAIFRQVSFELQQDKNIKEKQTFDVLRYRIVLYFLIQNAVKFSYNNKVRVHVKKNQQQQIETMVSDQGEGIAPSKLKNIFQMYSQVDGHQTSLSTNGVGLGLSTCKRIVEYIGGHITIQSVQHQGTDVIFTINTQHISESKIVSNNHSLTQNQNYMVSDNLLKVEVTNQVQSDRYLFEAAKDVRSMLFNKYYSMFINQSKYTYNQNSDDSIQVRLNRKDFSICSQLDQQYNTMIEKNVLSNASSILIHSPNANKDDQISEYPNQYEQQSYKQIYENEKDSIIEEQVLIICDSQTSRREQNDNQHEIMNACECAQKVLVVDDQDYNLIPLGVFLLKEYNIQVDKSQDGCFAVDRFKALAEQNCCRESYKLILMDINMPKMDGISATQLILEYCRLSGTTPPVVCALTAYDNHDNRQRCLDVGMTTVLHKPLSFTKLKEVMQNHYFNS